MAQSDREAGPLLILRDARVGDFERSSSDGITNIILSALG